MIKEWSRLRDLHLVSQGMLIYAVLNSSGYYIDRNELTITILFTIILIGTTLSLITNKENKISINAGSRIQLEYLWETFYSKGLHIR